MRIEDRVEKPAARAIRSEEPKGSVIFSDAFVERRKKKDYQHAVTQIAERARKLEW